MPMEPQEGNICVSVCLLYVRQKQFQRDASDVRLILMCTEHV